MLLSSRQLPDLRDRFDACCARLGLDKDKPEAYLLQGGGALNAFATRFLGRHYVVLLSDIVDAMQAHPDGINFYFGHELGHVRMKHLTGRLLRAPVLWLPLLGAAYSRAKESTCDRHGRACCESPESAARAMVALAAGAERWRQVDLPAFEAQASLTRGFWMSYHELTGGYPWLTKRVARVLHPEAALPARNGFAYVLALFSPYVGRGGGALGIVVLAAVIGVAAAVGIPAYRDYETRSRLTLAYTSSEPARRGAGRLVRRAQGAARLARGGRRAGDARRRQPALARGREHGPHRREPARRARLRARGTRRRHGGLALLGRRRRARGAAAVALPRGRRSGREVAPASTRLRVRMVVPLRHRNLP